VRIQGAADARLALAPDGGNVEPAGGDVDQDQRGGVEAAGGDAAMGDQLGLRLARGSVRPLGPGADRHLPVEPRHRAHLRQQHPLRSPPGYLIPHPHRRYVLLDPLPSHLPHLGNPSLEASSLHRVTQG
jgi:hypothetical protein